MSNQKLESALAELKKFREVMEPEAYEFISNQLQTQLEHDKDCGCKVCNGVEIYVKKYELPEKFPIGLHSSSGDKINAIIDYLKARENAK